LVQFNERLKSARSALKTLGELTGEQHASVIHRDAAIQRFEYTFEAIWKTARVYLREFEGLDVGSPKGVLRACYQVGILNQDQTALGLQMVDDRNMTSHTYHAALAVKIYKRLKTYADLMDFWMEKMEQHKKKEPF